jgi:hypothetical protein
VDEYPTYPTEKTRDVAYLGFVGGATQDPTPHNIPVLSLALTTKDHHLSIIEVFQPCDPPKQPGALLIIKIACKWTFILLKYGIVWYIYILH